MAEKTSGIGVRPAGPRSAPLPSLLRILDVSNLQKDDRLIEVTVTGEMPLKIVTVLV